MQYDANDLFQVQTELVEAKVDMAVNKAIESVVHQIVELRTEMRNDMHDIKHEMNTRFSSLDNRMTAVETKLGMVHKKRDGVRAQMIDYAFKGAWLVLTAIFLFTMNHVHLTIS